MILGEHHAIITRLEVFDPFHGSKRLVLLPGEDHLIIRVDRVVQIDLRRVFDITVAYLHRLLLVVAQGHIMIDVVRSCDDAVTHQRLIVIKRALLLDRLERL